MIPYGSQEIREEDIEAVSETLKADLITQGPKVEEFEQALCDKFGCAHAVAVNNGTMALRLAYQALGVEEADEVVTSPITFLATANGILYNDGHPHFVDIDPETFNLSLEKLEKYLSKPKNRKNLKGIAPVHFAGQSCRMEQIYNLAQEHDLFVLEDACHAPGAEYQDSEGQWHKVGACTHSDAAVLSFHPVKHFTTGEGGVILTNDKQLAEQLRKLRHHGITQKEDEFQQEADGPWYYEMQELGHNGRLTDFQCALGIKQLKRLEENVQKRREIAHRYDEAFNTIDGVQTPVVGENHKHAYHLYVIQAEDRDELYEHLTENDIAPQVHYIPVHLQPYYQEHFDYQEGDFPGAEKYYGRALSLPMFPTLEGGDIEHVIKTVKDFYS